MPAEHALLLGRRQTRVERQDAGALRQATRKRLGGVTDLPLAAEEDEDVAGRVVQQLLDRVADRIDGIVLLDDRAVTHLDGIRAARDLDDRGAAEVLAE